MFEVLLAFRRVPGRDIEDLDVDVKAKGFLGEASGLASTSSTASSSAAMLSTLLGRLKLAGSFLRIAACSSAICEAISLLLLGLAMGLDPMLLFRRVPGVGRPDTLASEERGRAMPLIVHS